MNELLELKLIEHAVYEIFDFASVSYTHLTLPTIYPV